MQKEGEAKVVLREKQRRKDQKQKCCREEKQRWRCGRKRKKKWCRAGKITWWLKSANQVVSENPPLLVEKGCNDHLVALISRELAHYVHLLGVH